MPDEPNTNDTNDGDEDQRDAVVRSAVAEAQIAKLLAVPGVRDVLKALKDGREISVVDKEELDRLRSGPSRDNNDDDDDDDLDDDDFMNPTDPRNLQKVIGKTVGKALEGSLPSYIEKALGPVTKKIELLENDAKRRLGKDVQAQIDSAKKKYPDWGKYAKAISEIAEQYPTLDPEEWYALARARAGSIRGETPDTEKPELFPGLVTPTPDKAEEMGHGGAAFRGAARSAALDAIKDLNL